MVQCIITLNGVWLNANSNNILLIRIPYTDFDKIDINYLKERIR